MQKSQGVSFPWVVRITYRRILINILPWVGINPSAFMINSKYFFCFVLQLNGYAWFYLLIKLIDLMDTVFFVLRKKQSQLTCLHVYHHTSVVLLTVLYVRFTFSENIPVLGFFNSFVHVFMYSYYFLAGLGPEMKKRLWWKRYITSLQLLQFVVLFIVMIITVANSSQCQVNKTSSLISVLYVSYFLYLFGMFYKKSYCDKAKKIWLKGIKFECWETIKLFGGLKSRLQWRRRVTSFCVVFHLNFITYFCYLRMLLIEKIIFIWWI